jgi:hypothetical protein
MLSEDLAKVMGTLVDNALNAVGPLGGGHVSVEVVSAVAAVRVEARDSGPGVTPELVEEFFTSRFTTKAVNGGPRGFGLALTSTICRRLGGTVSVRNDDGAVFSAYLPLRPSRRAMIRVVVVDDDFVVAKLHAAFVSRVPGFLGGRLVALRPGRAPDGHRPPARPGPARYLPPGRQWD